MKKIKILRIIARLNIGGPAIHTILLSEGLDKDKFHTLLVCGLSAKDEGDMFYCAREKGVVPIFISELRRELSFLNDLSAFKKIYQIIKVEKPDIIHTHTAKAGALGRLAGAVYNLFGLKKKIKLIHTFHGHIFEGYFSKLKIKLFILIERFLALFTDRIITVSDSVRNELISLGICKKDKIEVIPLGLELDKFLKIGARDGGGVINIGIVGRLVPVKNHCLFLEAAARVIRDNPQLKLEFKIIGDGELKAELEKYSSQLNISKYVNFLGWQRDLVGIYSDLDIIALTSLNEGTPVSLIEAMAAARPVVATDVGGVRDLLGAKVNSGAEIKANFELLERGIVVKPREPQSLAEALNLLLQDLQLRSEMGLCARNFVKIKFNKDRLIKDIEGLYNRILICTPSPPVL